MRNFSYSFIPILLKLYRCLNRTLKMCMWFGYEPQVNFHYFFRNLNFDSEVHGQRVPCARNSSYSFIPILLKLYRCLDHALKMCMWFGYNCHFNFYHFFEILT